MKIRIPKKINPLQIHNPELLFLLGLFLKQFYLRKSGSIQIGDIIIMASVLTLIMSGRCRISYIDISLMLFVMCTFIVNGIYTKILGKNLMRASLYLFFNLLVVIAFRLFSQEDNFIKRITSLMKLCLLMQLLLFITGIGRSYSGSRYQGTFNDPNQFGFFIICCLFMLFLCYTYLKKRMPPWWYLEAGILVLLSGSRGMTVAFFVFLFFAVIQPFLDKKPPVERFAYFAVFIIASLFVLLGGLNLILEILNNRRVTIIANRFESLSTGDSLWQKIYMVMRNRQMGRVLTAPIYFLYGSGEGYWERFLPISNEANEIHSTMVALCYYYGIIPYSLFLKWLYDNLNGIPRHLIGVYVALIIEAFTLINHRQPLFWIMFVIGHEIITRSKSSNSREFVN